MQGIVQKKVNEMCHNLLKFSARKQISEVNFPLSKMTGVRKASRFSRPNIIYNTSVKKKNNKKNVVTVKNLPEVFCERSKKAPDLASSFFETMQQNRKQWGRKTSRKLASEFFLPMMSSWSSASGISVEND